MKLTFRVNESESVIIQKNDIVYIQEAVEEGNESKRLISVLTKTGFKFHIYISIHEMKNAFTFLVYDEESYLLHPEWIRIANHKGKTVEYIKGIGGQ
jgi:hypothetical protein